MIQLVQLGSSNSRPQESCDDPWRNHVSFWGKLKARKEKTREDNMLKPVRSLDSFLHCKPWSWWLVNVMNSFLLFHFILLRSSDLWEFLFGFSCCYSYFFYMWFFLNVMSCWFSSYAVFCSRVMRCALWGRPKGPRTENARTLRERFLMGSFKWHIRSQFLLDWKWLELFIHIVHLTHGFFQDGIFSLQSVNYMFPLLCNCNVSIRFLVDRGQPGARRALFTLSCLDLRSKVEKLKKWEKKH